MKRDPVVGRLPGGAGLVFLSSLALIACGGSPASSGAAASSAAAAAAASVPAASTGLAGAQTLPGGLADPCSFLTAADIEPVVGGPVTQTEQTGFFPLVGCRWSLEPGTDDAGTAFERYVEFSYSGDGNFEDDRAEEIPGIADGAYEGYLTAPVVFHKGERVYHMLAALDQAVDTDRSPTEAESQAAIDLAKIVAGRL